MYKYDGVMVYQNHDDEGLIEIIDKDGIRALHFGSDSRQSTMSLSDPNQLNSLYTRAMMALLLFNDHPKNPLMIGLGGGALTKFLLHHFENNCIQVVEYRKSVVKIAQSHFGLPLDSRLAIHIGCGGKYVASHSKKQEGQHDLIMVDAYDHQGMVNEVSHETFFDHCRTLLQPKGMLVINLWGSDKDLFQTVTWNMGRVFDWRILFLPVRKRGNIIGFAFREQAPKYSLKYLRDKALILEDQYQLEFPTFVRDFKRHNTTILDKVIQT
jgi:spermidine synthase